MSGEQVRQPRLQVLIGREGGQQQIVPSAISAEINNNGFFQADKFRVVLSLNRDPAFGLAWIDGLAGSGTSTNPVIVEVKVSLTGDAGPYISLIVGEIDTMDADLQHGKMTISGRDLTRRLIDAKTQQSFKNQTASQIATLLAAKHNLIPVITTTQELVGRAYLGDHDRLTGSQFCRTTTEWDLLTYLAREQGFVAYVKGRELHFEPAPTASTAPTITAFWDNTGRTSNVMDLQLSRSLTLAKDWVVEVRSWDERHAKGFTKTSPSGSYGAIQSGKAQLFTVTRGRLSEAQAQELANKLRAEITAHERTIEFKMPGDLTTQPHGVVALTGDVGSWAQSYFIDSVTRSLSFDGGFTMTVHAKNHSPDSDALV